VDHKHLRMPDLGGGPDLFFIWVTSIAFCGF